MLDSESLDEIKRTKQFLVRLSKNEMKSLDKKVQSVGMTREGYVRNLIKGYTPVSVPPMDYFNLIKELRTIGNNMQQLAQRANSLKFIDVPAYKKNADKVLEICDYIFSLHLPVKVGDKIVNNEILSDAYNNEKITGDTNGNNKNLGGS